MAGDCPTLLTRRCPTARWSLCAQHEDRQSPRPNDPVLAAPAGGPDHRMTRGERVLLRNRRRKCAAYRVSVAAGGIAELNDLAPNFVAAVTGGVLVAPLAAWAQQGNVRRIGSLGGPGRETAQPFVQPFLKGIRNWAGLTGKHHHRVAICGRKGGAASRPWAELIGLRVDSSSSRRRRRCSPPKMRPQQCPRLRRRRPLRLGSSPVWRDREETSRG